MPQASIIIPLYNGWNLTRQCLKALAATTAGRDIEVIVVDNASTDVTPQAAPFLGKQLFEGGFQYIRNERNRNFGPASNQAACQAKGEYLVLLNNDTEPLTGWYDGLMRDFEDYPGIAGTGPLLAYPETKPFGRAVQHLGVYVNEAGKVGHLYRYMPAGAPLARKRRFFQVITAACLAMPRRLFTKAGMFDERYVNGFEDVDLCARLSARGFRFTVNPDVTVIHHESQTPGRHGRNAANSVYYMERARPLLKPDLEAHARADGLELRLSDWLVARPALPAADSRRLDEGAARLDFEELKNTLAREPLWENGWRRLLAMPGSCLAETRKLAFMLFPDPRLALEACADACKAGQRRDAFFWLNTAAPFGVALEEYRSGAEAIKKASAASGNVAMANQAQAWLAGARVFEQEKLRPFLREFSRLKQELGARKH